MKHTESISVSETFASILFSVIVYHVSLGNEEFDVISKTKVLTSEHGHQHPSNHVNSLATGKFSYKRKFTIYANVALLVEVFQYTNESVHSCMRMKKNF